MKPIVLLFGLTFAANAQAATAYEALNVVGKQHGQAVLDRVIEVRGKGGAPTPRTWRIVVKDKEARGGVREYDVQGSKLVGDRAPADGAAGESLDLNNLNVDSDGAHTVAEREAKKSGYAYDHVDYVLRRNSSGPGVWEVRLVDERGGKVATLNVGADSGKMIASNGLKRSGNSEPIAEGEEKPRRVADSDSDEDDVDDSLPPPPSERRTADARRRAAEDERRREEQRRREERDAGGERPGNKIGNFFQRAGRHIGNAFQKAGDKVDRTFNGGERRTAETPPSPPPRTTGTRRTYRDSNGTEYYRPRD